MNRSIFYHVWGSTWYSCKVSNTFQSNKMYLACPVHSCSASFTLRNRKEHSSCLLIARNLPSSSRAESCLVLPLLAKRKNLLWLCWQEASGDCCLFQPTDKVHISIYVETPISALRSMTSHRSEVPLRMISIELHLRMLNVTPGN